MALPKEIKRMVGGIYAISDEDGSIEIYKRVNNVYEEVYIYSYTTADVPYFTYALPDDGLYRVKLTGTTGDLDVILPIFPNLINNVAKDFKSFVCDNCGDYLNDCGCNDISAVSKRAVKYNTLASKILYLETYVINSSQVDAVVTNYNEFILASLQSISCKSAGLMAEILRLECLQGISESSELYELVLVLRFLGIYLTELNFGKDLLNEVLIEDNTLPIIPDLYLYDDWKDCLCKTCLRIDEVIAIYDSGVVIVDPNPTNYPPTAANIVRTVLGVNGYYNYDFLLADFGDVYNDDNTVVPVKIIIESLPSTYILEDNNDIAVSIGQEINYGSILNYRCNHTDISEPPATVTDSFTFRVSDGELESPIYTFTFLLITVPNYPPNVIKDFGVQIYPPNTVSITKEEVMSIKGFVSDPEGDEITLAKIITANQVDIELWDGAVYQPYVVNDIITLANYTNTGQFLRLTYNVATIAAIPDIRSLKTSDEMYMRMVFLDAGSNSYSNSVNVTNFMHIYFDLSYNKAKLIFTGGYSAPQAVVKSNWIPLARIEYEGDYKDLVAALITQTGYISTVLPFMIIPATEDTPFDVYENSASIVVSGTTNPTKNSYDIYVNTNMLNTRSIEFKITDGVQDLINITSDILVKTTGNENPVAMHFLEFDETNIADFVAYETAIPADFLTTIPNPALSINFDEVVVGQTYTITSSGLIGFAIETSEIRNPTIYDSLGNDITTTTFKKFFDATSGLELYISYGVYTPSTLYIKFEF